MIILPGIIICQHILKIFYSEEPFIAYVFQLIFFQTFQFIQKIVIFFIRAEQIADQINNNKERAQDGPITQHILFIHNGIFGFFRNTVRFFYANIFFRNTSDRREMEWLSSSVP